MFELPRRSRGLRNSRVMFNHHIGASFRCGNHRSISSEENRSTCRIRRWSKSSCQAGVWMFPYVEEWVLMLYIAVEYPFSLACNALCLCHILHRDCFTMSPSFLQVLQMFCRC